MKMNLAFVFMAFILKRKVTYAFSWESNRYSELDVYLQGFTFSVLNASLIECYGKCLENILCSAIMMNLKEKTCELKYATKNRHPKKTFHRHNTIYMEIRDDLGPAGSRYDRPIPSCKKLKEDDSQAKSGVYWMKINEPSSEPFQVFCDMTTDGGGWTLVYSYTFTLYSNFRTLENAVTPIPNWPVNWNPSDWVPQSTTTPLSESSHSAMEFALWEKIGKDVLIKSNITNWVACVEGTGSLVNWVAGDVTCRVVKSMTPTCTTVVPNKFAPRSCGPTFDLNADFYVMLDGKISNCWPIHDPCGRKSDVNHLNNVPNHGGAIYLR